MSKMLRDEDGRYTSTATKRAQAWADEMRVKLAEQKARDAEYKLQNKRWSECEWHHEWHRKFCRSNDKLRNALHMAVMSGVITRR